MQLTNPLLHALLVACDQSYQDTNHGGAVGALAPFGDSGQVPNVYVADTLPNAMPTAWKDNNDLSGWTVEKRIDDSDTGFGATVFKKDAGNGKFDYIVALQGTRGPSAVDWNDNLTYGWRKFEKPAGGQALVDYLTKTIAQGGILDRTNQINFTGQSLGGALAQYTAYRYVDILRPTDKSFISLTTFNGLGGVQGLIDNYHKPVSDGGFAGTFIPSLLAGVTTAHFYVNNDVVCKLGTANLNGAGNEYVLNFTRTEDGTHDTPAHTYSFIDAHRIETGFYHGFNSDDAGNPYPGHGDFTFTKQAIDHVVNLPGIAAVGTAVSELFNDGYAGGEESFARTLVALIVGGTQGSPDSRKALIKAFLDSYVADGTLTRSVGDYVSIMADRVIAKFGTTLGGVATLGSSVLLTGLTELVSSNKTLDIAAAVDRAGVLINQNGFPLSGEIGQVWQDVAGALKAKTLESRANKGFSQLSVVNWLLVAPALTGLASAFLDAHVADIRDAVLGKPSWSGSLAQKIVQWTSAAAGGATDAIAKTVHSAADSVGTIRQLGGAELDVFAQDRGNEMAATLLNFSRWLSNALPDFTADYSDAPVTFAEITAFADQAAVVSSFTTSLKSLSEEILGLLTGSGNATAAEAIRQTLDEAAATVLNAAQKVILGNGIGPNPFESGTADPDAFVSLDALKEGSALTLSAYLPYASGKDGQSIRFKLAGVGDSAMRIQDGSGVHTVTDGEFTLTVAPGRKEEVFTLWALGAISADAQLSLSATLSAVNGTPTHQTHIEATGTLVNRPDAAPATLTLTGDLAPILDAQGRITKDALGNVVVNPRASMPNRADELYGSGGGDVIRGGGGDDTIRGKEGADRIEAGSGADIAEGDAGNDTLEGGGGQDLLTGAEGDDTIYGEDSVSLTDAVDQGSIAAGSGERGDWEDGGGGDDVLVGSVGNDALMGGADNDILLGGGGDDDLYGDWQSWVDRAWQIQRQIISENGVKRYTSTLINAGGQEMAGGNDLLYGGGGNDVLYVEAGNDGHWRQAA